MIQFAHTHWKAVLAVCGAVLSALVHAYQIVVQAGGARLIVNNFINGKPSPEGKTAQPKVSTQ
jgi:hypothetical protein